MYRNYFFGIVLIALACLMLIFYSLWREIEKPNTKEPPSPPVLAPYKSYISAVGIVEASSGNISIRSPLNRIVDKVLVSVGEKVKKGERLILLENRDLQANSQVEESSYQAALARLKKLKAIPRTEDVETATTALNKAQAVKDFAKNQYEMVQALPDPRAISQEEKDRRFYNYREAVANWELAQIELEKVKAGTWKADLDIAMADVLQAQNNLHRLKTEIERTIITSPITGTVLQINIHEGELAPYDNPEKPLLILGNIETLNLCVSINQFEIPFFHSDSPAVGYIQDNTKVQFPLKFIRVEPYVTNKKNLTHELMEKTDTRVLRVIYQIETDKHPLFVGQQMDVFIKSDNSP